MSDGRAAASNGHVAARAPVLLLTGRPGVGKTTLVRRLVQSLGDVHVAGFYTEEVREGGVRVGFRAVTFDGHSVVMMAHVDIGGPGRVGKYGVDLVTLDALAGTALRPRPDAALFIVDEIGRMECLSNRFVAAVREIVEGTRPLVATIGMRGVPLLDELRGRPGVTLWEVTAGNRDRLAHELVAWVRQALG